MIVIQFTIIYYCVFEADLVCPNSGSEIVIDGIGMESQTFRFPAVGTFGFPEQVYLQPIILIVLISFFLFEAFIVLHHIRHRQCCFSLVSGILNANGSLKHRQDSDFCYRAGTRPQMKMKEFKYQILMVSLPLILTWNLKIAFNLLCFAMK